MLFNTTIQDYSGYTTIQDYNGLNSLLLPLWNGLPIPTVFLHLHPLQIHTQSLKNAFPLHCHFGEPDTRRGKTKGPTTSQSHWQSSDKCRALCEHQTAKQQFNPCTCMQLFSGLHLRLYSGLWYPVCIFLFLSSFLSVANFAVPWTNKAENLIFFVILVLLFLVMTWKLWWKLYIAWISPQPLSPPLQVRHNLLVLTWYTCCLRFKKNEEKKASYF